MAIFCLYGFSLATSAQLGQTKVRVEPSHLYRTAILGHHAEQRPLAQRPALPYGCLSGEHGGATGFRLVVI